MTKVIAILGMHRSGTSWLTGSLQDLGLELGEVNAQAKHNPKGNRENRFVRRLHEEVLRSNGGSWRHPTWPNRWTSDQSERLSAHIAEMSKRNATWGFKDPRALLVLDEWQRQTDELVRVGIYRHPTAVFRSLHARTDDFTPDEAVGLWRIYNERLLAEHAAAPFPIIRFDVPTDVLERQLAGAASELGISTGRGAAFFDPSLVHNAADDPVPDEALDVWDALETVAMYRNA